MKNAACRSCTRHAVMIDGRSETLRTNEGIGEIDDEKQGHGAAKKKVDRQFAAPSENVADFGVGHRQDEQQNTRRENNYVHWWNSRICVNDAARPKDGQGR